MTDQDSPPMPPAPPVKETYSIRPATLDDLDSILDIERESFPLPWTKAHFEEELSKPFSGVWVLTDDETDSITAGYIVFWFLLDECQILNTCVSPRYRGLGYGKQLVRKVCQDAIKKSLNSVILDVRKSNLPAITLYQSTGFSISSIRKGFYSDGEDAYQMRLALTDDGLRF